MRKKIKILIKDAKTYGKVTKQMDKEGVRWWATGDLPSDSMYNIENSFPIDFFPIYLCVDECSRLSWSESSYTDDRYSEITPEEYLKEDKTMTKADLKDWMIVEDNLERRYLVNRVHETLLEYGSVDRDNKVFSLDFFTDDLCRIDNSFYITRIFTPSSTNISYIFDGEYTLYAKPIWERPTPPAVEMTVAEIEEKLGIKNLKIVKEDE